MTGKTTDPRVFISYSWSSPQHESWVIDLAERLSTDGVDTVLDKWDLKEGQDKFHFMEQMVRDSGITKVLMICDQVYAEKADGRLGGVGTESQIISKEVYDNVTQEKFIPLVVQLNSEGKPSLPTFVGSRIYLDFTDNTKFEDSYEKLLRNIYNRPRHQRPARGVMPAYLQDESGAQSYRCVSIQKQLNNALMKDHQSAFGLLDDLFESVLTHLEEDRQLQTETAIDEKVLNGINRLLPIRDSIVDAVIDLCKYKQAFPTEKIKEFLEKSLQFNYRPQNITNWHEYDFDVYKFFNLELVLYLVATLLKKQRYTEAAEIIYSQFFYYDGQDRDDNITVFNEYLRSLEDVYKRKINSNLITITGEQIKERGKHSQIKFSDILLADCLLYMVMSLRNRLYEWYPRTLVYRSHFQTFDFFVRLKSVSHFEKVKSLFGVKNADEFKALVQKALADHAQERNGGSFNERNFPPVRELANLETFCTVG